MPGGEMPPELAGFPGGGGCHRRRASRRRWMPPGSAGFPAVGEMPPGSAGFPGVGEMPPELAGFPGVGEMPQGSAGFPAVGDATGVGGLPRGWGDATGLAGFPAVEGSATSLVEHGVLVRAVLPAAVRVGRRRVRSLPAGRGGAEPAAEKARAEVRAVPRGGARRALLDGRALVSRGSARFGGIDGPCTSVSGRNPRRASVLHDSPGGGAEVRIASMSAVERRLVQARGCDDGDAPDDRHRRQSAKGPRECGCTLRIAAGAPPPFVRVAREQRRALVGAHPTRKSERGPDAFDFARGCAGFTTRHGIARRSRTPYGIDASESPWVVRLLTSPHVLSRVARGPAQVLFVGVGCYKKTLL